MNVESFEYLELLPQMMKKIDMMSERIEKFAPPLTTKKEVARFLNKSERTINNYIEQGYLIEGHHFHRKNGKMLVFVEDAILKFRDELHKGIAHEEIAV